MSLSAQAGKKYGRLTLVRQLLSTGKFWLVRCDCGNERNLPIAWLKSGNTSSCGCLRRELRVSRNLKHGESHVTSEYQIWKGITKRCCNPNCTGYSIYGGRGITICEEWREDYSAFLSYVGRRPSPKHSIDRYPNQNGNYEPGNVRWATPDQQSRNMRRNVLITFNGQTKILQDWAIELGLPRHRIENRLRRGWTTEQAFSPFMFNGKRRAVAA